MMKWEEWYRVARDEKLWQNREEKGLLKAEYVTDYILRLWFEENLDISIYELDFYPLLVEENPGGIYSSLKDIERFWLVEGNYALIWLNPETGMYDEKAIDVAPECIRFFCERYGKKLKASERIMVA
ncbi:MAG TPA: hypothetical protein G4N96_04115 [Chloroflexi bacterium]|nr:hypothetical protein [Chloroflexota bacterium]